MKDVKVGLKGILLMLVIGGAVTFGLASIYLTKPIASTGTIITNMDFAVYNEVGCTTLLTTVPLGDVKRGDVITKLIWVKFLTAPETNVKMQWNKGTTITSRIDVKLDMYASSSWMDVTINTPFGDTIVANTLGAVIPLRLTYTISNTPLLGESVVSSINLSAGSP